MSYLRPILYSMHFYAQIFPLLLTTFIGGFFGSVLNITQTIKG